MKNNRTNVFFDMDGVLAEFPTLTDEEIVQKVWLVPKYFENLKPFKDIHILEQLKEKYNIKILSKIDTSFQQGVQEKKLWLKKYLPFINEDDIFIIDDKDNKGNYITCNTDVLIDDYGGNLEQWAGVKIRKSNHKRDNKKFIEIVNLVELLNIL